MGGLDLATGLMNEAAVAINGEGGFVGVVYLGIDTEENTVVGAAELLNFLEEELLAGGLVGQREGGINKATARRIEDMEIASQVQADN